MQAANTTVILSNTSSESIEATSQAKQLAPAAPNTLLAAENVDITQQGVVDGKASTAPTPSEDIDMQEAPPDEADEPPLPSDDIEMPEHPVQDAPPQQADQPPPPSDDIDMSEHPVQDAPPQQADQPPPPSDDIDMPKHPVDEAALPKTTQDHLLESYLDVNAIVESHPASPVAPIRYPPTSPTLTSSEVRRLFSNRPSYPSLEDGSHAALQDKLAEAFENRHVESGQVQEEIRDIEQEPELVEEDTLQAEDNSAQQIPQVEEPVPMEEGEDEMEVSSSDDEQIRRPPRRSTRRPALPDVSQDESSEEEDFRDPKLKDKRQPSHPPSSPLSGLSDSSRPGSPPRPGSPQRPGSPPLPPHQSEAQDTEDRTFWCEMPARRTRKAQRAHSPVSPPTVPRRSSRRGEDVRGSHREQSIVETPRPKPTKSKKVEETRATQNTTKKREEKAVLPGRLIAEVSHRPSFLSSPPIPVSNQSLLTV